MCSVAGGLIELSVAGWTNRQHPWNFSALAASYDPCIDALIGVTCSASGRVINIDVADVVRTFCSGVLESTHTVTVVILCRHPH